jgi:hypothetical protein
MWSFFLQLLGFDDPPACKATREALRRLQASWIVSETRIIANEGARCVIAVFYDAPGISVKPPRYKLFAVSTDLKTIEELPVTPDSPYWIKGRK